jgi:phospholipase/carboxylesterase
MKFLLSVLLITSLNPTMIDQDKNKMNLYYLVRQPKIKLDKPPLLILLHGVGSNEEDLFSFANELPGNFLVISARAPYTMGPGSYAWYQIDYSPGKTIHNTEQEEKSRAAIIQFITDLRKNYSFDEKQVYLCGFSQGAIMSYSVGLTRPDLVKGIAIMSGRLLDNIKPQIANKEKLKPLRVFISHGTKDQVLDVQYARNAFAYLKSINIHPVYKEYVEGHGINEEMFFDLNRWLKTN